MNKQLPRKVTITTAATLITSMHKRSQCLIFNDGGVRVGLSTNSAIAAVTDGYPLDPGAELEDISSNNLYGIVAAGTCDVWVWETDT